MPKHALATQRIQELVESEESYIWTDNREFQQLLVSDFSKIMSNGQFDIPRFRFILFEYYKTIVRNIREIVPKAIVYHLIRKSLDSLNQSLFEKVLTGDTNTLLEEFPEIEQRRRSLEKNRKDLVEIKKLIETIL